MMKLSYRDKSIALALTVVLILVGGAFFIVKPEIEKYNAQKLSLATKQQEQETVQAKIDTFELIQSNILNSLSDIESLQEPFYVEQRVYQMEQMFHEYCDQAGMDITTISLSLEAASLDADQYTPAQDIITYPLKMNADLYGTLPQEVKDAAANATPAVKPSVMVGSMSVSVTFDGVSYWQDMEDFIDVISGLNRTIMINSLSLGTAATEEEGGSVYCSLSIYNIVPMDVEAVFTNERDIAQKNGTVGLFDQIVASLNAEAEVSETPETPAAE
jgi:hypothetical protein